MPETESKNSRPVVFSFDCNTEFHFIEQKKQQFLYFAGVIATIIFLVFKVEINFSLHRIFILRFPALATVCLLCYNGTKANGKRVGRDKMRTSAGRLNCRNSS